MSFIGSGENRTNWYTIEFDKMSSDEETADSILEGLTDIEESSSENDIFNLIDSMYDEEEK